VTKDGFDELSPSDVKKPSPAHFFAKNCQVGMTWSKIFFTEGWVS
jgi:hypothetical protein